VKISVVIPASGAGLRLGGDTPKQFLKLGGEPILKRTISIFEGLDMVSEIAVAVPVGYENDVSAYGFEKLKYIISGEKTRAESVYAALKCLNADTEIVLIHDGIRPFVTPELIKNVAEAVRKYGAAVACAPVTDTIKEVDAQGKIISTPNRQNLWRAQTPQGFSYEIITRAYQQAESGGYLATATDDSALVERLGISVFIVPGSDRNIKITTPPDLITAQAFVMLQ